MIFILVLSSGEDHYQLLGSRWNDVQFDGVELVSEDVEIHKLMSAPHKDVSANQCQSIHAACSSAINPQQLSPRPDNSTHQYFATFCYIIMNVVNDCYGYIHPS
jgi:hypothetical protein